jgi:hypothetical protein
MRLFISSFGSLITKNGTDEEIFLGCFYMGTKPSLFFYLTKIRELLVHQTKPTKSIQLNCLLSRKKIHPTAQQIKNNVGNFLRICRVYTGTVAREPWV